MNRAKLMKVKRKLSNCKSYKLLTELLSLMLSSLSKFFKNRYFALKEPWPYNLIAALVLHGGKCPKCDELWYEFGVVSACFTADNKN